MQRRLRKDTNDVVADTEGNKAIAKIVKNIAYDANETTATLGTKLNTEMVKLADYKYCK